MSKPAADCFTNRVMPTTEACARWAEPKASQTKRPSQRAASCFENASSFFSSSGWKRTFSRRRISPSASDLLFDSGTGPTQSEENRTGRPMSSSSFLATCTSEYFESGPPLGRPRCEATTRRPPFSMARRSVGSVSRMRVSSVTTPSLSGTLKSTRMNTRLPRRSRSLMVSLVMVDAQRVEARKPQRALELGRHQLDEVAATARIGPFVVVPGENFYATIPHDLGITGVNNRRIRITFEVGGNKLLFGVLENALHRALRSRLQRSIDGRDVGRLIHEYRKVDHADVGRGHAHRVTIEFSLQLGNHEMQRLGGARGA